MLARALRHANKIICPFSNTKILALKKVHVSELICSNLSIALVGLAKGHISVNK